MTNFLPLVEKFHSLQGEGFHTGKSAYFIRLAGCNVGCSWCDTKHSWDQKKYPLISIEKIVNEINKGHKEDFDNEITKYTNKYLKRVHDNLENFSYNKIIANLYEMYSFLNKQIEKTYTKNTILENYEKILVAMTPILPHFASECLSIMNIKNFKWPEYDVSMLKEDTINVVIQINGKKRGLVQTEPNITEEKLFEIIKNDEKIAKYFDQKNIKRKIYIKDKLLNIII